jgi:hypothetical protein
MDSKTKLILAQMQIENVYELLKDGQYAGFFSSHLFPVKFEIQRQLANLTNTNYSTKIKE